MERLMNLLSKTYLTPEEIEEIQCMDDIDRVEFNGNGEHPGYDSKRQPWGISNWYTIYFKDGTEKDVYSK